MGTVAITSYNQHLLDAVLRRIDRLDTDVRPTVAAILAASEPLPAADRLCVHRRLRDLGQPPAHEWARILNDRR
jgi:hypothetical protein